MFGYVTASLGELSQEQRDRYTEIYCGICAAIGKRSSQLSRIGLQYDMVFLALTLMSLYEPEERKGRFWCLMHPEKRRSRTGGPIIDYAADMNVALSYLKSLDDWQDDRKTSAKLLAKALKPHYDRISGEYPRQCRAMEESLEALGTLEKGNILDPDRAANTFGQLMGTLFVWKEDLWQEPLYQMGFYLGRFIYLVDAQLDLQEDQKKGSYNPLLNTQTEDFLESILVLTLSRCAFYYEKLPLVQDKGLLDNILYSGVWVRYREHYRKERNQ